jgi:hypothetical protein
MHPNTRSEDDRSMTLREARKHYASGLLREYKSLEDPRAFSTFSRTDLIAFYIERLRWIECAPEGAWFTVAPMQDKRGVPCGVAYLEDVGPGRALREARVRFGVHPLSGRRADGTADVLAHHRGEA